MVEAEETAFPRQRRTKYVSAATDTQATIEQVLEAVLPSQSVQTPNVNCSSLNDMFKVVARVFQQIMTELSGVESEYWPSQKLYQNS
jgi:hypothetical protein